MKTASRSLGAALVALALLTFSAVSAPAATETYQIDPAHSTIGFSIKHLFSKVTGRFVKVEGKIAVDFDQPETSSVEAKISAETIDTANATRDKHLKSPDFFDTAKFADITFKSKSVKKIDDKTGDVTGDLTMHGVTKEVVLHVTLLGKGDGPKGPVSGWEATTTLNRRDYGLVWGKAVEGVAMVGDTVDITLNIEADLTK